MIRTEKQTPLGFGYRITSRRPPQRELSVVLRGRFVLAPGIEPGVFVRGKLMPVEAGDSEAEGELARRYDEAALTLGQVPLQGDVHAEDDTYGQGALCYPTDFAEYKPRTDFIVKGSCHPPGGSARRCKVAIELEGKLRKELAVFGDRRWIDRLMGGKHSEPEPFERMPLDWTRAFGGTGSAENPVGRGLTGNLIPNVEDPRDLLVDAGQKTAPAGFGPVNGQWPLRSKLRGTRYDEAWRQTREPFYPEDYDWTHQNAAPADQQIVGPLRGDERLVFENMHPEASRLETRLPGLRPRAFVARATSTARPGPRPLSSPLGVTSTDNLEYVEVALVLDTVLADLDAGELFVSWRGLTPVREDDLSDVPFMLIAHEDLSEEPQPAQAYCEELAAFARDPMGFEGSELEAMAQLDAEIQDGTIDERIDAVDDERSDAVSEVVGPLLGKGPEGEQARVELSTSIDDMERRDPGTKARLKVELKETLRQISDGGGGATPELRSDGSLGIGGFLRQVLRGVSAGQKEAAGESGHDFSGTNALLESELRAAALPGVAPADLKVPDPREEPPEPAPGVDLSGYDLSERDLRGVDLTGANLDGANLSRADLREAILVGASLVGAALGGADLSGADCQRACFRLASMKNLRALATDFRGADLGDAHLTGADLGDARLEGVEARALYVQKSVLEGASFRGSALGKAFFDEVQAEGADFSGARLDYAMMRHCALAHAHFDGAALNHAAFFGCNLDHATFLRAQGERVSFQQSSLRHLDARYARFQQPQLAEVDAREADFSASRLTRGRFYKSSLRGANLQEADLFGLDLRKASLTDANFRKSNLYRALLHEAHGTDADFRGANLAGVDFRRSELVMKR